MRRGWKILIAVVAALVVLLGLNALAVDRQTKPAEVTVDGGEILKLPGGDLQAVERGPRNGPPIVLIHCFTCAIDWWDGVIPLLAREHRVIAVDLLGHGGSEKPTSGYSIPNQADLVAQALGKLGVRDATVVGHSLGGGVVVALANQSPDLVNRVVIIDTASAKDSGSLGLLANLAFTPVIGEALWRIKPDFAIRKGLEEAFAPGFDVPDAFVDDVKRMTFSSYDSAARALNDYKGEETLAERMRKAGKPLMVLMGEKEQIIDDPEAALDEYAETTPNALTNLIRGVGHSPNVEAPKLTATIVLTFDAAGRQTDKGQANRGEGRPKRPQSNGLQNPVQDPEGVR
ncbi:MAG TPA: alpha/beta hydrolase [Solirubrobacterales bacterium]|jgi:pimeloyl-ACP methyl ester carboxylesterase